MNHPSNHELQEFADDKCGEETGIRISLHLRTCAECRSRVEDIVKIGKLIRRIDREQVSKSFTERVMRRLKVADSPSLFWLILKNIAPVIGLIIVIGIVYTAMTLTGVLDLSGAGAPNGTISAFYDKIGGDLSSATSAFSGWFKRYFPFLYSGTGFSMIALLIVIVIVALIDRYIFIPLFKRRV